MTNLTSIISLLQIAISLLNSSSGTPAQPQAIEFANRAVVVAQQVLSAELATKTPQTVNLGQIVATGGEVNSVNQENNAIISTPTIKKMYSIEIINPINGKGLGERIDPVTGVNTGYRASPQIVDESNYLELGVIVRDENGSVLTTPVVTVTATDSSQNKTLNGAQFTTKIYVNGQPQNVVYYPFHYEFHSAGDHTITFSSDGVEKSVTVKVNQWK